MESFIWKTRHFAGKTDLPVLTPAEWLERFAEDREN
jgi:RecB family exonuclease